MSVPRHFEVTFRLACGQSSMHVMAFGDVAAPAVVCVHGLTRNGHDFDALAASLCDRFYVVVPDLPGRGGSAWLVDPEQYRLETYVAALRALIAALGGAVALVGTSLGGICGLALAGGAGGAVTRLVLNDIGPEIPAAALARIRAYVTAPAPVFAELTGVEAYLRRVHAPFGDLSDGQWANLARHSARAGPAGGWALHYDPAIAVPIAASGRVEGDMWGWWRAIRVPVLVLRGATSDVLTPAVFARMGDKAALHSVAGAGHAPALLDAATIAVVRRFLLS